MLAKPLEWNKPSDHPHDMGCEDAVCVAVGIGGRYSIEPMRGGHTGFLLWWAEDNFTFAECATVEEAQTKAEADWQQRYADLGRAALNPDGDHG